MTLRSLDPPVTEQAAQADRVWDLFLFLGYGVLALIVVLVCYVVVRFRRRDDRLPRQKHYNIPMEVTYTLVPLLVVVGLFAVTVVTVRAIDETDPAPDLVVHVTAFQWQWQFDYPDSGVSIIGGADGDDPELVLPANSSVRFDLESLDVIHSFWITAFRFKRDIIPGRPTAFSVDIDDSVGEYPNAGVCAEYCGLDHARMLFSVRILSPDDFDAWLMEKSSATVESTTDEQPTGSTGDGP